MVRVFKPGLLSIIGTSPVFAIAWLFLSASYASCAGIGCLFGIVLGLGFGLGAILLLAFSIVLFVDTVHHRVWGAIVSILYGLGSWVIFLFLNGLTFAGWSSLLSFGGMAAYVLGLAGGVWGFFAGTSWTPSGVGKTLVGSSGRVFLGGVVSFVSLVVFGVSIYLLAPFVLVLGPLLLRVDPRKRRIVGAILLAASLATALPFVIIFPYLFLRFGGLAGYDGDVPSFVAIIIGGALAGSGAFQLIRRRDMDMDTRKSNLQPV